MRRGEKNFRACLYFFGGWSEMKLDDILNFLFRTRRGMGVMAISTLGGALLTGGCFLTDVMACACDQTGCVVWREQAAAAVAVPVRNSRRNPIGEIEELHRLMKAGIISEEEFEEKKAELLKRI